MATAVPASESGSIEFTVEARLLQELGERLVASPEVALLELVKNASDADAPECKLILTEYHDEPALVVEDNGSGMSAEDFKMRWMRIATNSKRERLTPRFQRVVTGQKGIGRFAIRFIGAAIRLTSISVDPGTKHKSLLEAVFDWKKLDQADRLQDARVRYRISAVAPDIPTGTQLTIWRLKQDLVNAVDRSLLTRVLQIASPFTAFDAGPFDTAPARRSTGDPGFKVTFQGFPTLDGETTDIAKDVIDHAWARLTVSLRKGTLKYSVRFHGDPKGQDIKVHFPNRIGRGLHADIAFAPKRKDAFLGVKVQRPQIWSWLKANSGVGVIDNGFRIRPYGFKDDDWLYLNQDGAHNKREWRSEIAAQFFPLTEYEQVRPGLNPALNIANSLQVIGAVYVSSRASDDPDEDDLVPAMDREGFLLNTAYHQMVEVVRGGIEYLAKLDKARQIEALEAKAEAARLSLRSDLAKTAAALRADPRLAPEEKAALVQHYSELALRVTQQESYDQLARQRLEIASGLGVVAGFMTHEAERLFLSLDNVVSDLQSHVGKIPQLGKHVEQVLESRRQLDGYIRYTRLYTDSLRINDLQAFSALGQIEWVQENFGAITKSRGIETDVECAEDVEVPAVPVAMYSAVLLNLYTNAAKAILARQSDDLPPMILISAWNDAKTHHLTVQDTGVGIPIDARKRVWDPFYTTTSRVNSPFGSGMGLGLSLVSDLVGRVGGKAEVAEPSYGFVTCLHVTIPKNQHAH